MKLIFRDYLKDMKVNKASSKSQSNTDKVKCILLLIVD